MQKTFDIWQWVCRFLRHIFLGCLILLSGVADSQVPNDLTAEKRQDHLKQILLSQNNADSAIGLLKQITQNYFTVIYQLDSAKKYADLLYELSKKEDNERGLALGQYYLGRVADGKGDYATATEYLTTFLQSDIVKKDTLLLANGLYSMANVFIHQGNLEEALNYQLQVLRLDEISGDSANIGLSLNNLGIIMKELNRHEDAIQYLERTLSIFEHLGDEANIAMALSNLGGLYAEQGDNGKALITFRRSLDIYTRLKHERGEALALEHIGTIQGTIGDYSQALKSQHEALVIKKRLELKKEVAESYHQLGLVHRKMDHIDSAKIYFNRGLDMALQVGDKKSIRRAYKELSDLEARNNNFKSAYEYIVRYDSINNSILNESIANQISQLETKYGVEKKEAEINSLKAQHELSNRLNNTLGWALIATALVALMVIGFLVFRTRANKKMLNLKQTQNRKLEEAYDKLKSTQAQLIQSEKMASLGELTAGIAHEIRNPLNFVNNFSEVSSELIDEVKMELVRGNREDAMTIIDMLRQNLEKVNYHGKRADGIVMGMLQHSRSGSGQKESTDINLLCDECLRLSYHGLRSKDKSFSAKYELKMDTSLARIDVVPQEIGRVILNLINNAFYAVGEKKKQFDDSSQPDGQVYEPIVIVSSKRLNGEIEICVKDNGNGIPDSIREKIFQPFFTTKPTGQGTGLGLSLAYDIVKAHGGEIKVKTRSGDGSEFIVVLPS